MCLHYINNKYIYIYIYIYIYVYIIVYIIYIYNVQCYWYGGTVLTIILQHISCQSLIKENCHNSRTSNVIDIKLRPVIHLTREAKQRQKFLLIMLTNCDVIVIFPIYGQFGAIWKPDSGHIVCKAYIFIKVTFYLTTENRTKKFLTQLSRS